VIYFIGTEDGHSIKIGYADDPRARLDTLQTGCPQRLALLAYMDGGPHEERALHKRLAAHRIRGEWFKPNPELDEIMKAAKVPVDGESCRRNIPLERANYIVRQLREPPHELYKLLVKR